MTLKNIENEFIERIQLTLPEESEDENDLHDLFIYYVTQEVAQFIHQNAMNHIENLQQPSPLRNRLQLSPQLVHPLSPIIKSRLPARSENRLQTSSLKTCLQPSQKKIRLHSFSLIV